MRILFLLFLFINLYIAAFCQVIKGTIYEEKTNDIICFATVYFNGTFVGTLSDQNGNFELNISNENRSMPLTVSCIGYHSVTITEFSVTIPLIVYMQPQLYELKDGDFGNKYNELPSPFSNIFELFRNFFPQVPGQNNNIIRFMFFYTI